MKEPVTIIYCEDEEDRRVLVRQLRAEGHWAEGLAPEWRGERKGQPRVLVTRWKE